MDESMTNSGDGPSQTLLPHDHVGAAHIARDEPMEQSVTEWQVVEHTQLSAQDHQSRPLDEGSVADGHDRSVAMADADHSGESNDSEDSEDSVESNDVDGSAAAAQRKRRRGSRGGQRRRKPTGTNGAERADDDGDTESVDEQSDGDDSQLSGSAAGYPTVAVASPPTAAGQRAPRQPKDGSRPGSESMQAPEHDPSLEPELPERPIEGKISDPLIAARVLVPRRPQVGDTMAPPPPPGKAPSKAARPAEKSGAGPAAGGRKHGSGDKLSDKVSDEPADKIAGEPDVSQKARKKRPSRSKKPGAAAIVDDAAVVERRKGRERNGRPVGRYLMAVQVRDNLTQVAVLEGRSLIEHYVSRPADDISQIHGNIYLGRVQNILPGMEAAFVDIATPKNAVLYRGDVQYDSEDLLEGSGGGKKKNELRIEQMLKAKQLIVCQVTKNPIGAKGARLTQDVSLPGRFVVLIPNSATFGISKRLPDDERKRLRSILDRVKPAEHGLIVRTAAESATEEELRADVQRLSATWNEIAKKAECARKSGRPALLYREPPLAVRVIREEFNAEYRNVVIDDRQLFEDIHGYVSALNPELADRVEFYDAVAEGLPLYERNHVHEQVHKALDRKVWLPSGGSLIIEHTEALTVIDVNTGKNVGSTNLEETVFYNNLEAAEEIARQLRLRDIGGIIVIDFIDMEIRENRKKVVDAFRSALSRDKTRTQVFDITELGLVEMTRKRIGEGLLTSFTDQCPNCEGRGVMIDLKLLE